VYIHTRGGKSIGGPRKFFEFPENISPRKKNIIVKI
jgi:hypothetical protein